MQYFTTCFSMILGFFLLHLNSVHAEPFFNTIQKEYNLQTLLRNSNLKLPPPPNTWNSLGVGLNQAVKCIFIDGTDIYAGGTFTDAGGDANADYFAKFNGTTWEAVGAQSLPICSVNAITKVGTDIFIGGTFVDAFGNSSIDRIAKWNGSTWSALGAGLASDVYALEPYGTSILIGGKFLNAGGIANADYITLWNGTSYQQVGTGVANVLSKPVRDIKVVNSTTYICGEFLNAGGNASADYVAKMTGTDWLPVCPVSLTSASPNIAYTLDIYDNILYVGGTFIDGGGVTTADYIAKTDGTAWSDVGGGEINGNVYVINVDGNGNVYTSGDFYNLNGNSNNLFVSCLVANAWQPLATGLNGFSYAIEMTPDNLNIFFGGTFDNAGGNSDANFIAKWEASILPVDFIYFNVLKTSGGNVLKWKVTQQSDVQNFIIEHSTDGIHFNKIGNKYNSTTTTESDFLHYNPNNGENFYRLKAIDSNEDNFYSKIININNHVIDIKLRTNIISNGIVEFENYDANGMNFEIFDSNGQSVFSKNMNSNTIALPKIDKGNYIININNEKISMVYKIIIQ